MCGTADIMTSALDRFEVIQKMSNGKEERDVYYIPGNFLTSGRLFGGMIRVRNAIEACALVLITGYTYIYSISASL